MTSKREKILLACMGAVGVAAAAVLLWPSSPAQQNQVKLEEVSKGAQALAASMGRLKLSKVENYILSRAAQPWTVDPFYPQPLDTGGKGGGGGQAAPAFVYSGFIDAGTRKLAVINGTEYQAGEQLESGGYEVVDITADQVVLEEIGKKSRIAVPYQDTSFFAQ
jgi:hypothetical protein